MLHAVALGKLGQLHRASGLGQKVQSFHHHAVEKQQVLLAHVAQGLYEHLAVYNGLPRSHARQFMLVASQPIHPIQDGLAGRIRCSPMAKG